MGHRMRADLHAHAAQVYDLAAAHTVNGRVVNRDIERAPQSVSGEQLRDAQVERMTVIPTGCHDCWINCGHNALVGFSSAFDGHPTYLRWRTAFLNRPPAWHGIKSTPDLKWTYENSTGPHKECYWLR